MKKPYWKLWWHDRLCTFLLEIHYASCDDIYYLLLNKSGRFVKYNPPSGDYYELIDEAEGYWTVFHQNLFYKWPSVGPHY